MFVDLVVSLIRTGYKQVKRIKEFEKSGLGKRKKR